ncbi:putative diphthamide synthesis domain-containing protein [Trichoderma barbatum]
MGRRAAAEAAVKTGVSGTPALDCDLLVHYAHSCLIPVHVTKFKVLYAFVEITIDASHLLAPLQRSFASSNFKLPLSQESQRSGSSLVADAIVHPRSEKKGIACENTDF